MEEFGVWRGTQPRKILVQRQSLHSRPKSGHPSPANGRQCRGSAQAACRGEGSQPWDQSQRDPEKASSDRIMSTRCPLSGAGNRGNRFFLLPFPPPRDEAREPTPPDAARGVTTSEEGREELAAASLWEVVPSSAPPRALGARPFPRPHRFFGSIFLPFGGKLRAASADRQAGRGLEWRATVVGGPAGGLELPRLPAIFGGGVRNTSGEERPFPWSGTKSSKALCCFRRGLSSKALCCFSRELLSKSTSSSLGSCCHRSRFQ